MKIRINSKQIYKGLKESSEVAVINEFGEESVFIDFAAFFKLDGGNYFTEFIATLKEDALLHPALCKGRVATPQPWRVKEWYPLPCNNHRRTINMEIGTIAQKKTIIYPSFGIEMGKGETQPRIFSEYEHFEADMDGLEMFTNKILDLIVNAQNSKYHLRDVKVPIG